MERAAPGVSAERSPVPPLLARQPILDRDERLVAYELLFRGHAAVNAALVGDDSGATAAVLAGLFTRGDPEQILGPFTGYINVGSELLASDVLEILPRERVMLEILETVPATDEALRRCATLRQAGYALALDDVVSIGARERAFLPYVRVVKVDLLGLAPHALEDVVDALRPYPVELLAEKVDERAHVDRCKALGFALFQGFFFARPQIVAGRRPDPAKLTLLRVLALLASEAEVAAIEEELKRDAALTYGLLRIVNSAASGLARHVDSVRQAIVVLGRRELSRWVQLLLYAARTGEDLSSNPLLRLAAGRGRLLENLAHELEPRARELHERAFMTGVLSLLDSLLGAPLAELLDQLLLADEVRDALLARSARLGRMLVLAEALERGESAAADAHLAALAPLDAASLERAVAEAFAWVNALGREH